MFNRLIILALLFLASEKTSSQHFVNFLMTFSDALPVQFWPVACATYNEHEASGMYHKCFCAPWECDDEIKIQFTDVTGNNYSLQIYNSDDELLDSIDIEEITPGTYQVAFIPSENSPDVCDQQIQLKIQQDIGHQAFDLPALSEWTSTQEDPDDVPWTTGASPTVELLPGTDDSELLTVDFAFIPGLEYTIQVNYNVSGGGLFNQVDVLILDSSFNTIHTGGLDVIGGTGPKTSLPLTFTADASTTKVGFTVYGTAFGGVELSVTSTVSTRQVGAPEVVAKSDCLDLRTSHPESILIHYTNHRNFAGINYETSSPDNDFYLRVPAVFYHQRFPEEDEVMELSSSLVTLNGTIRKQRQLEVDYVPYYFHEKLKLILKHQFITILDRQWVKQEGYEIVEGERRWPVKKAKCWLSEKDFVHRNIL